MKTLKFIAVIAAFSAFAFTLKAGQETQTCTNSLAVASTNTFAIPGDITGSFTNGETLSGSTYIAGGIRSTEAFGEVGGYFRNTTAASSNVVFTIAQSVTGSTWTNSALSVTVIVPAASTNYAFTQFSIANPAPFYSLRSIGNANAAAVTADAGTCYLKVVNKTGL